MDWKKKKADLLLQVAFTNYCSGSLRISMEMENMRKELGAQCLRAASEPHELARILHLSLTCCVDLSWAAIPV